MPKTTVVQYLYQTGDDMFMIDTSDDLHRFHKPVQLIGPISEVLESYNLNCNIRKENEDLTIRNTQLLKQLRDNNLL